MPTFESEKEMTAKIASRTGKPASRKAAKVIDFIEPKTRLTDLAYEKIEEAIVTLVIPPGAAISEQDLVDMTGIGRTPIREAIQRLAREQWVSQRRDPSVRRALDDVSLRDGLLPPDPAVETATYIQNIAVVAGSGLLSIAPRRPAEQQQALGQIAILDFKLGVEPMQVCMLVRGVARHNAMLDLFRQALMESIGT